MTGSEAWPGLAGRLTDVGHILPIRVYFEDTDFSGMVYHASYLRFMERGRSDFLRLLGISHRALAAEAGGPPASAFAVTSMSVDFKRPARIDDVLTVETRVTKIGAAAVRLSQVVQREEEELVMAEVSVVLVNNRGKPQRVPSEIRKKLATYSAV
jgi:acyl-CoA thioester hydrolase